MPSARKKKSRPAPPRRRVSFPRPSSGGRRTTGKKRSGDGSATKSGKKKKASNRKKSPSARSRRPSLRNADGRRLYGATTFDLPSFTFTSKVFERTTFKTAADKIGNSYLYLPITFDPKKHEETVPALFRNYEHVFKDDETELEGCEFDLAVSPSIMDTNLHISIKENDRALFQKLHGENLQTEVKYKFVVTELKRWYAKKLKFDDIDAALESSDWRTANTLPSKENQVQVFNYVLFGTLHHDGEPVLANATRVHVTLAAKWKQTVAKGLKWKKVKDVADLVELTPSLKLRVALQDKFKSSADNGPIKFQEYEWESFGIRDLRFNHFVRGGGGAFFQPSIEPVIPPGVSEDDLRDKDYAVDMHNKLFFDKLCELLTEAASITLSPSGTDEWSVRFNELVSLDDITSVRAYIDILLENKKSQDVPSQDVPTLNLRLSMTLVHFVKQLGYVLLGNETLFSGGKKVITLKKKLPF